MSAKTGPDPLDRARHALLYERLRVQAVLRDRDAPVLAEERERDAFAAMLRMLERGYGWNSRHTLFARLVRILTDASVPVKVDGLLLRIPEGREAWDLRVVFGPSWRSDPRRAPLTPRPSLALPLWRFPVDIRRRK